jgi:hypothetical protein
VEKEILFLTFDFDEPETFISETGDSSFLHSNVELYFCNCIKTGTGS